MVLVCDLGNTNVVFGFFKNDELVVSFRLVSSKLMGVDEYVAKINSIILDKKINIKEVEGIILSSVMPSLSKVIFDSLVKVFDIKPLIFKAGIKSGLPIQVDNPSEVGSDLIASCVGAKEKYGYPLVLVDLGTATKINVIDKNGAFIGCTIAPGIKISNEALINVAMHLPLINYEAPKKVIGKNTKDSMNSALIYGTASMLDGMVKRIERELGYTLKKVATGGLRELVISYCETPFIVDDDILLYGLYRIYLKNGGHYEK